ncbi:MAG: hypothetical protein B9S34_16395 [Opitutia bacterium Tous-C1TDCM]|nr:MAG: hypothetical protein B9S34_16395 [Opitutae bacterium Tous-C1TDCM]
MKRSLGAVGAGLAVLAATVLFGRFTGRTELVTLTAGGVPMAFPTALGFMVAAAALAALAGGRRRPALAMAVVVALHGWGTLAAYAAAGPLGWTWLVHDPASPLRSAGVGFDGRMSPAVAAAFGLTGLTFVIMILRPQWRRLLAIGAACLLALAGLALAGQAAGLRDVSGWWQVTGMAVHTATAFLAVAVTVLFCVLRLTPERERTSVRLFPFFAVAAALVAILGLIVPESNVVRWRAGQDVRAALETKTAIERFIAAMARTDTSARNFALTGNERFAGRVAVHRESVLAALRDLERLAEPEVQASGLRAAAERNLGLKLAEMEARRRGGVEAAVAAFAAEPAEVMEALRAATAAIGAAADRELARRDEVTQARELRLQVVLALGGSATLGLLATALLMLARAQRGLRRMNDGLEQRVAERTAELARAGAQHEAAEAQFRSALLEAPIPVLLWTEDGNIALVNRVWLELSGYAAEELPTLAAWSARAFGDRPALPDSDLVRQYGAGSRQHEGERRIRTKAGTEAIWDFHTARIGGTADGRKLFVTKAVDVTRRRRAEQDVREREERLRFLADTMPQLVWTCGPDGLADTFNRGWESFTGLAAAESLGSGWLRALHPDDRPAASAEWEAMQREDRTGGGEYRLRRADDGEWRWHLWRAHPQRDEAGRLVRWIGTSTDVHEQKLAAATLERRVAERTAELSVSRERLATIFSTVADGIVVHGPDGAIIECNEAATRILGLTVEQLTGRSSLDPRWQTVREDGAPFPGAEHPAAVALRTGRAEEGVVMGVSKPDGSLSWISISARPLRGDDGKVKLVVASFSDITERRRVALDLGEQEARLRLVVDEMPVGLRWIRKSEGKVELVTNPAHEEITGVSRTQADVPGIYLQRTHPDDIAPQEASMERMRRGELSHFAMEKRYLHAGGRVRWAMVTWFRRILPGAGNFEELSAVVDITAQKEAELALRASLREVSELRAALDAHALVLITDRDGIVRQANSRFCAVSGYTEAELVGRKASVLKSGYHPPDVFEDLWRTIGRGAVWRGELRNRAKDGADFWVATAVVPSLGEQGEPRQYIAIQIDITERRRLEESLAQARDAALEASRLKSEFMATISHEIRTPMNAVVGMAELLGDSRLDEAQREMVRSISAGADGLLTIVNDVLEFSKMDAGRLQLRLAAFDLRQVIEDTVSLLGPRAREKDLAFALVWPTDLPVRLRGDAGRVRQVFTNLLGNAIKFTDAGAVRVTVQRAERAAEPGRIRLRFEVRDSGVGIGREFQSRLFEPFLQEDGSATRRFGGTGLGLAISRQLVVLMGGMIGFASPPPADPEFAGLAGERGLAGTAFWFEADFEIAAGERNAAEPAQTAAVGRSLRVLVVEDNPQNQRVAALLLGRLGHTAEWADNGAAALEYLAREAFDAVLMDCQMPGLDGYETTGRIRRGALMGIDAAIPVIALTAHSLPEDRERCLAAGMDDYVPKPVRSRELAAALGRCVPGAGAVPPAPRPTAAVPAVLDESVLAQFVGLQAAGGRPLVAAMLAAFTEEEPARLAACARHLEARAAELLAADAHRFAGSCASLGAIEYREALLALERAARAGDWSAAQAAFTAVAAARVRLQPALARRAAGPV